MHGFLSCMICFPKYVHSVESVFRVSHNRLDSIFFGNTQSIPNFISKLSGIGYFWVSVLTWPAVDHYHGVESFCWSLYTSKSTHQRHVWDQSVTFRFQNFKKVLVSVWKKFVKEKSIGIGIEKNWHRKKVSGSVSLRFWVSSHTVWDYTGQIRYNIRKGSIFPIPVNTRLT